MVSCRRQKGICKGSEEEKPEVQEDQGTERSSKTSKTLTSIIVQGQHLVFQALAHKLKLLSSEIQCRKKELREESLGAQNPCTPSSGFISIIDPLTTRNLCVFGSHFPSLPTGPSPNML